MDLNDTITMENYVMRKLTKLYKCLKMHTSWTELNTNFYSLERTQNACRKEKNSVQLYNLHPCFTHYRVARCHLNPWFTHYIISMVISTIKCKSPSVRVICTNVQHTMKSMWWNSNARNVACKRGDTARNIANSCFITFF
jgi:hypothetical protein